MKKINNVFAIQCYGPSGTTLLHSLLDDHPEIISMPFLYPIPIYYIWDNFLNDKKLTFSIVRKTIEDNLQVLFDPSFPGGDKSLFHMGVNENETIKVDKEEFFSKLRNILEDDKIITRKSFLLGIYIAFNECYGKNIKNIKYLCFPLHDQPKKYAKYLYEDFKVLRVIHIIRDPIKTIGSIIKHINSAQQKFSVFKSLIYCSISNILMQKREHWEEKFYKVYGKTPYFKDDEKIQTRYIKLEDLHLNNKVTIGKIINWLNIQDNPNLYQSTFMGLIWYNRAESLKAKGVSKNIINQKQDLYLNVFDKYRLKLLCKTELEYFKYYKFNIVDSINLLLLIPILIFIPFKCDFNIKRIMYRFRAMTRLYSNKRPPIHLNKLKKSFIFMDHISALIELTLLNTTCNLVSENELSKICKLDDLKLVDIFFFIIILPFYLLRIVINYITFRYMCLKIYYRIITSFFIKNEIYLEKL